MLKKLVGVLAAAFIVLVAALVYMANSPAPAGVLILEYHMVDENSPSDAKTYNVMPADFRQQLTYLQENGYTAITMQDYMRARKGKQELPEKPVILTFDDGYASNYTQLWPILKEYNMPAVIYMVTNDIGLEGYLTWDQLKELQNNGIEIGSHTANHLPLSKMPRQEQSDEMLLSKQLMEWNGMQTIYAFSYPNGDYDQEMTELLKKNQFLNGVTGDAGLNLPDTNPYLLQRLNVPQPYFGLTEFKLRLLKNQLVTKLGWRQHRMK